MRHASLVFSFTAALAGCQTMMGSEGMRTMMADAADEEQMHLAVSRAANTLPILLDEVDRHAGTMETIMDDMGSHMREMTHCSDVDSMMTLQDGMRAELVAHASTMRAMTDLVLARAEAETHVGTMVKMLDDMTATLDGSHCGGW